MDADDGVHNQYRKSKKYESESYPEISSNHSKRHNDVSSKAKRSAHIISHRSANISQFTSAGPSFGQTDFKLSIPGKISYGKAKREIIWQKCSGIDPRVSRHERATLPKFSMISKTPPCNVHREIPKKEEREGGDIRHVENPANHHKKKVDAPRSSKRTQVSSTFDNSKVRSAVPAADYSGTFASPVNCKTSEKNRVKLSKKDSLVEKTLTPEASKKIRSRENFPAEQKPVVSFKAEDNTNIPSSIRSSESANEEQITKCDINHGETMEAAVDRLRRELLCGTKNYVSRGTKKMYRQHDTRRIFHNVMERNEPYVGLTLYKKGGESRKEKESPSYAVSNSPDSVIKKTARGLLLQSMFLALVTTIAIGMASVDTYYFTDMTEKLFYRTPPSVLTDNFTGNQPWLKTNKLKFKREARELIPEARANGMQGKSRCRTGGTSSVSPRTRKPCGLASQYADPSVCGKTEKAFSVVLCEDFPNAAASRSTISNTKIRVASDLKPESSTNIRNQTLVSTTEFATNMIRSEINERKHDAKILLNPSERLSADTSDNHAATGREDFADDSHFDKLSTFANEPFLISLPANNLRSYKVVDTCAGGEEEKVVSLLGKVKRAADEEADINCRCCPRKSLEESHTISDFWMFAETTLVQMLYWQFWFQYLIPESHEEDLKNNFFESQVMGVPRVRQVRVKNDSCVIHPSVSRFFNECYNYYTLFSEETRPIRNDMEGSLTKLAWRYTDYKDLHSTYYFGKVSTYGGGGYYIDLSLDINETTEMIKELKNHAWITKSTRAVFVDFTLYNVNINLFCVCKIVFEFPPTGGMIPRADFSSLKFLRYLNKWDFFILGCELFFAIFIIFFTVDAILRLKKLKSQFFRLFWSYIDIIVLLLSYSFIIYSVIRFVIVENFMKSLPSKTEEHVDFWHVRNIQEYHNYLVAVLVFFSWVQLIQYLNFTQTMMELRATFRRSVADVFGFAVLFFIIFFAFAQVAYLMFGSQLEEYSSLWTSCMTLLQAVIGEFEYKHLEEANRVVAPIFFIVFIFFIFFILMGYFSKPTNVPEQKYPLILDTKSIYNGETFLCKYQLMKKLLEPEYQRAVGTKGIYRAFVKANMFLAIINDSYAAVKSEIDLNNVKTEDHVRNACWNIVGFCLCGLDKKFRKKGGKYHTYAEIKELLQRSGFSDVEVEVFFRKYNINLNQVMSETENKRIINDLELKGLDFNLSAEQALLDELTRRVNR